MVPTYSYACKDCGHSFDIVQSFSDDALTTCPECGGHLRKQFGSVGVVFKGSGFYKTDSRDSTSAGISGDSSSSSGSKGAGSGDSGSGSADKSTSSGGDKKSDTASSGSAKSDAKASSGKTTASSD